MGTAVLQPQDCLMKNPYFHQPLISPPSKPVVGGVGRNRNRSPRSGGRRKRSPSDNESDRSGSNSKSMVDKFSTKDLVMGQVKILKRGEKIENPPSKILNRSNEIKEKKIVNTPPKKDSKRLVEENFNDDLITKERLGPEPEIILKEISSMMSGLFSGSVAVVSPSPSSLPIPKFSLRKKKDVGLSNNLTDDNDSATKDLMRILGMK